MNLPNIMPDPMPPLRQFLPNPETPWLVSPQFFQRIQATQPSQMDIKNVLSLPTIQNGVIPHVRISAGWLVTTIPTATTLFLDTWVFGTRRRFIIKFLF